MWDSESSLLTKGLQSTPPDCKPLASEDEGRSALPWIQDHNSKEKNQMICCTDISTY